MTTQSLLAPDVVFSHALAGERCRIVSEFGEAVLPVDDWQRSNDAGDNWLVSLCQGASIDLGCGPGRLTAELAARGQVALGIDVVGEAVSQTRLRGAGALQRDLFSPVPGEGRWQSALLADGNIGIGGDPVALLTRVRRLLRPGGRAIVEVNPRRIGLRRLPVQMACDCGHSDVFPWAMVGADVAAQLGSQAGFDHVVIDSQHGRTAAIMREAP